MYRVMNCRRNLFFLLATYLPAAWTQVAVDEFEVASVKPAAPRPAEDGKYLVRGGPGSSDPGLARFDNIDLLSLVAMAYGVQRHQLSGPDWLSTVRFDITARVKPQKTQEEYRRMIQTLMAERFKLVLHGEKKELRVYELVVAKNGPKLAPSPNGSADASDGLKPPHPLPNLPVEFRGPVNVTLDNATMEPLANDLAGLIGEPVIDETGLAGHYNIRLRAFVGSPIKPGYADVFEALQDQLALKLIPGTTADRRLGDRPYRKEPD